MIRNKEDESVQIDVVWRAHFLLMLGLHLIEKVSVPSLVLLVQTVTLRQISSMLLSLMHKFSLSVEMWDIRVAVSLSDTFYRHFKAFFVCMERLLSVHFFFKSKLRQIYSGGRLHKEKCVQSSNNA